ncbi:MAG: FixH family protein [Candidatus Marinimicrobia bacterium]|nr:FixH family protein [Candidatus Neomarinimicrobiota bacterium]
MNQTEPSGRMWMWGTILTIVVFIAFFTSFAIWTYQKDVELVYDNYYDKDVVFGQQIRRVERTDALEIKPIFNYDQKTQLLTLRYSKALGHVAPVGEVLLFRPADLHKDRLFPLDLTGDTLQKIHLPNMDPGLWRIKLDWASGGLEYYLEQTLMIR